ncbi:sensor histidine kinase [Clavibacter sp. Sh2088]|uniref:sensor histidine kinase n=1 Tax=Clavibacter sp. Sh2088 TaxID=3397676 RepID=UPI0039E1E76B
MSSPATLPIPGKARLRLRTVGRETALLAVAFTGGVLAFGIAIAAAEETGATGARPTFVLFLDLVAGLVAMGLLPIRRQAPVGVAVTIAALGGISSFGVVAALIAVASVSARRRPRGIAAVAGTLLVVTLAWEGTGSTPAPIRPEEWPLIAGVILLVVALPVVVGLYVGGRRELLASLRERARLTEEEQALRSEQAADHERTRIAREMHDVLAHRLSLVALHAGALEYRDDLDASEVRATAGVVRDNARTALTELREVLGVLRDPSGSPAVAPPQPTLADLPELLDEARALGVEVHAHVHPDTRDDLPRLSATTSRHAYRVVQECLTNARRHAPGAPVEVSLVGRAGGSLRIVVQNPVPATPAPDPTAATPATAPGHGLAGIAERALALGGTLDVARRDGQHVVEAVLPWTA